MAILFENPNEIGKFYEGTNYQYNTGDPDELHGEF